jgi:hypothetical protein
MGGRSNGGGRRGSDRREDSNKKHLANHLGKFYAITPLGLAKTLPPF